MTYMSIRDEINSACNARTLFYLPPSLSSAPKIREMFVSKDVHGMVGEPWPDDQDGYRHASARDLLDAFTEGDEITVSQKPRNKDPGTLLARVEPIGKEIWDFRVPKPGRIRILGGFAEKNLFVALAWDYRENLTGLFPPIISQARNAWAKLFSTPPLKGSSLDAYLSDYINLD